MCDRGSGLAFCHSYRKNSGWSLNREFSFMGMTRPRDGQQASLPETSWEILHPNELAKPWPRPGFERPESKDSSSGILQRLRCSPGKSRQGRHFAVLEQPKVLAEEIRAFFRQFR